MAGKYVSHYSLISESWNTSISLQFSPTSNYFIKTGINYIKYNNVKDQHAKQVADNLDQNHMIFADNHALSYDFKIGYRF